ncbi:MAG: histidine ammonia-lyase [Bdellovibrio sp.]|nr:histidine ammonia-lyase [Bdellovibrio sp.]
MKSKLALGHRALTLEDVFEVAVNGQGVTLAEEARSRIQVAHEFLLSKVATGETFYGINTGFGLLSNVRIPNSDVEGLQYNLLRSHATGMGPALEDSYVRAMLLLRASNLAIGHSGVSVSLVEQIIKVLNAGIIPVIPEQGSVGASGDLAPLSHLGLVLVGEGRARYQGKEVKGADALKAAGLTPVRLGPKEGLALINGTQFMTALGVINLLEAEHLCDLADLTGSMSLEALRGTTAAFEPEIQSVRPHPGQIKAASNLRKLLLDGDQKSEISASHVDCGKVQDPYSLRCMPQVHGATRDTLAFVRGVLEREINSVTDNPLVFPKDGKILSGGNFHGQIVAIAMDALSIAVAELANISEQRMEKLINPSLSDLPPFLTARGGLNSGFMIIQVTAASIVSENKTLCHPASVDSIPTSADKEDHVSMGAWAARKASKIVTNTKRVLSLELMAASQGIDLLRPLKSTPVLEKIHALLRTEVKKLEEDRAFFEDYPGLEKVMASKEFNETLRKCIHA